MTFSRLAKLLALVLVAVAVWRARPPVAPARVAVLALPGTPSEALAQAPAVAAGEIRIPDGTTGAAFWSRLFTIEDDSGREPGTLLPLWKGATEAIRALAPPARVFGNGEAAPASAFAGSSGGAMVEYGDLTSGRLPPPYDRAIDAVTAAAATLGRDQWSDWIVVTPTPPVPGAPVPPPAEFQFARVGDNSYYFSPAWVVGAADGSAEPFLRGAERELRPLLATHVLEVWRRRDERVEGLFRDPGEARPAIVFDGIGQDVAAVFSPDTVPAAVAARRDETAQSVLRSLRGAVGADGVVLVVGGPAAARSFSGAWYRIVPGGEADGRGDGVAAAALEFPAARALLRHFAGVALDAAEKPLLPVTVASRYPVRARVAKSAAPDAGAAPVPWSAANLESLPGAVADGN